MLYLDSFIFPDAEAETSFIMGVRRTCYASFYPFKILSRRGFSRIDFEPVTILYGGNGTGKSTALHVIAEKAGLEREAPYNRTSFFADYVGMCAMQLNRPVPPGSCIITSDDVFDHMIAFLFLIVGDHSQRLHQRRICPVIYQPAWIKNQTAANLLRLKNLHMSFMPAALHSQKSIGRSPVSRKAIYTHASRSKQQTCGKQKSYSLFQSLCLHSSSIYILYHIFLPLSCRLH